MPILRIRLNFDSVSPGKARKCWFLLDTSTCRVVADLEYLIQKRFELGRKRGISVVTLYLEGSLLPSQEKIEVIRDNDVLSVVEGPYLSNLGNTIEEDSSELGSSDEDNTLVQPKTQKLNLAGKTQRRRKKPVTSETSTKVKNKGKMKSVAKLQVLSKQKQNNANGNRTKKPLIRPSNPTCRSGNSSNSKSIDPNSIGSESDTSSSNSSSSSTTSSSSLSVSNSKSHFNVPWTRSKQKQTYENGNKTKKPLIRKSKARPSNPSNVKSHDPHSSGDDSDTSSSDSSSSSTTSSSSSSLSDSNNESHINVPRARSKQKQNTENGKKTKKPLIRQSKARPSNPSNAKSHDPHSSGDDSDTSSSDSSSSSTTTSSSSLLDSKKESNSNVPIVSKQLLCPGGDSMSKSNPIQMHSLVGTHQSQHNMVQMRNLNSQASNGHIRFSDDNETSEQIPPHNGFANVEMGQNNEQMLSAAADIVQSDLSGKSSQPGKFLHSNRQKKKDSRSVNSRVPVDQLKDNNLSSYQGSNHVVTPGCETVQEENNDVRQSTRQQIGNIAKEPPRNDYSPCTPLHGPPRAGDRVAFKIVELSSSYTPEVSDYKEGVVLGYDVTSGLVELDLTRESLAKPLGDGNVSRKFELVYEDEDEYDGGDSSKQVEEQSTKVSFTWSDMIEPRLIA